MKKILLLFIISVSIFSAKINVYADPPWSANVKVSTISGVNEGTIAADYPFIYASYNSNPQKFTLSMDGGLTWSPETNFSGTCCDGSMYADDIGYLHISILVSGQVRYYGSTNNGTSWTAPLILNSGSLTSVDKNWTFNVKNRVYVGWVAYAVSPTQWRMYIAKSTDRGLSFGTQVQVNDGNTMSYRQWAVPREDPKDSNVVFFSMTWDRRNFGTTYVPPWQVFVAKSTDGGATWLPNVALPDTGMSAQLIGQTPYSINAAIAVSPVHNDVYVVWMDQLTTAGGKLNVFFSRSTNGGTSFLPRVKIPSQPSPDTSYHFQPWIECDVYGTIHLFWYDTRGFVATNMGGRKGEYYTYSTDRGVTWAPEERASDTTDLFSGFIGHYLTITTDSQRVYALWTDRRTGNVNHMYYSWRPLPFIITKTQNQNTGVSAFKLHQNYPNPFNPVTQIKYDIPKSGFVVLKVYDVLGKEVAVLVNKQLKAGSYTADFDGSFLASGTYFYKLEMEDASETKKMTLVK